MILETQRLYLRNFTLDDVEKDYLYSQEESRKHGIPNEVYKSRRAAKKHVKAMISWHKTDDYPYVYAVCLKSTDEYIGHVGLSGFTEGIEIGYAICEKYQGRGYATEIVKAYAAWGKTELGLEKIYGLTVPDNIASQKVLLNAGFEPTKDVSVHGYIAHFI